MKHIVKSLAGLLFLALGHCVFANKNYMETSFKRGLNNQIICLMRACYEAHKNGYILIEPIFRSFLHKDDTNLKFSDIYDLDYFSESLKKYLTIIPYCEKKEDVIKYSPEYFLFNYKISKEENIKLLHLANLVRLSLKLNQMNLNIAQSILHRIPEDFVAIHMRIENDWFSSSFNIKDKKKRSEYYVSKEQIFHEYEMSSLCNNKTIFLATDYQNKDLYDLWNNKGYTLFSALSEKQNLNYHVSAAIDFYICVEAKYFIGNSYSTFSINVKATRDLLHKTSYQYNKGDIIKRW